MQYDADKVNKIVSSYTKIDLAELPFAYFSFVDTNGLIAYALGHKDASKFQELIGSFYDKDKAIHTTYSFKTFSEKFRVFIQGLVRSKERASSRDVQSFFNELKCVEFMSGSIAMPISGIKLNENRIEFGPISITKRTVFDDVSSIIPSYAKFGFYIVAPEFKYRDIEFAYERARVIFDQFVNIIHYMVGRRSGGRVSIRFGEDNVCNEIEDIEFRGKSHSAIIVDGKILGASFSNTIIDKVPVEDPYFMLSENGNKEIWSIYSEHVESGSADLRRRIFRSIQYLGRAFSSLDIYQKLTMSAIAYEALFCSNKNEIFTPSIRYRIAESAAIISTDSAESRIEIFNKLKKYYDERSSLVHTGNSDISHEQVMFAIYVLKMCITKLLTDPQYKELTKHQDLFDKLQSIKFS